MLKKEAIDEFKQIYFEESGIKLSEEEATRRATELINLFEVLFKRTGNHLIPKIVIKES